MTTGTIEDLGGISMSFMWNAGQFDTGVDKSKRSLTSFANEAGNIADAAVAKLNARLSNTIQTWGMSANAAEIYQASLQGATNDQLEFAKSASITIETLKKQDSAVSQVARLTDALKLQADVFEMTSRQAALFAATRDAASANVSFADVADMHSAGRVLDELEAKKEVEKQSMQLDQRRLDREQRIYSQISMLEDKIYRDRMTNASTLNMQAYDQEARKVQIAIVGAEKERRARDRADTEELAAASTFARKREILERIELEKLASGHDAAREADIRRLQEVSAVYDKILRDRGVSTRTSQTQSFEDEVENAQKREKITIEYGRKRQEIEKRIDDAVLQNKRDAQKVRLTLEQVDPIAHQRRMLRENKIEEKDALKLSALEDPAEIAAEKKRQARNKKSRDARAQEKTDEIAAQQALARIAEEYEAQKIQRRENWQKRDLEKTRAHHREMLDELEAFGRAMLASDEMQKTRLLDEGDALLHQELELQKMEDSIRSEGLQKKLDETEKLHQAILAANVESNTRLLEEAESSLDQEAQLQKLADDKMLAEAKEKGDVQEKLDRQKYRDPFLQQQREFNQLERESAFAKQLVTTATEHRIAAEQRLNEMLALGKRTNFEYGITQKQYDANLKLIDKGHGLASQNMRGLTGDTQRAAFAFQQLAFMMQDASSVYALTGFSGAVRAGSNNLIQAGSLLGPQLGTTLALAAIPVGLIADHFARVKGEVKAATAEMQRFDAILKTFKGLGDAGKDKATRRFEFDDLDKSSPDSIKSFIKSQKRDSELLVIESTNKQKTLAEIINQRKMLGKEMMTVERDENMFVGNPDDPSAVHVTTKKIEIPASERKKNDRFISSRFKVDDDKKEEDKKNLEKQAELREEIADAQRKESEARKSEIAGQTAYSQSFLSSLKDEAESLGLANKEQFLHADAVKIARMEREKFAQVDIDAAKAQAEVNKGLRAEGEILKFIHSSGETLNKLKDETAEIEHATHAHGIHVQRLIDEGKIQADVAAGHLAQARAIDKETEALKNQGDAKRKMVQWGDNAETIKFEIEMLKARKNLHEDNHAQAQRHMEIQKVTGRGVPGGQVDALQKQDAQLTALENEKKLWEDGKKQMEKYEDPMKKMVRHQDELNQMFMAGAITQDVYRRSLAATFAEAHKQDHQGVEGMEGNSAKFRAMQMHQMEMSQMGLLPGQTPGVSGLGAGGGAGGGPGWADGQKFNSKHFMRSQAGTLGNQGWADGVRFSGDAYRKSSKVRGDIGGQGWADGVRFSGDAYLKSQRVRGDIASQGWSDGVKFTGGSSRNPMAQMRIAEKESNRQNKIADRDEKRRAQIEQNYVRRGKEVPTQFKSKSDYAPAPSQNLSAEQKHQNAVEKLLTELVKNTAKQTALGSATQIVLKAVGLQA